MIHIFDTHDFHPVCISNTLTTADPPPIKKAARLAIGSLTEEAHAHVCMNGFGKGRNEVAVVVGLWKGWGGGSHISTVTPGFAGAAEPSGLALSGAESRN